MGKKTSSANTAKKVRQQQRQKEKELWLKLIGCIAHIYDLEPWRELTPDAMIAYIPKENDRMVFTCCVQDEEDCGPGLMVFPSIKDYCAKDGYTTRKEQLRDFIEMELFTVFLVEKENVPEDVRRLYRRLALDFEDGLWPWVLHKRRGYAGGLPTEDALAFLMDCLGNFYMQLKLLKESDLDPDFEGGEMLLRFYSPKEKLWQNVVTQQHLPPEPYRPVIMREDSPKLKKLQALQPSKTVEKVEFDFGWLAPSMREGEGDEAYFPLVVVFADRKTSDILEIAHARPEEIMDCAFNAWEDLLLNYGIPRMLYINRNESGELFEDLADKLGVRLKSVKHLPAVRKVMHKIDAV